MIKITPLQKGHLEALSHVYVKAYRTRGELWSPERAKLHLENYLKKQSDIALVAEL